MFGILLLTCILIIATLFLLFSDFSSFKKVSNFEDHKIDNQEFLDSHNKIKKRLEKDKNEVPLTWNPNNTLESMKLEPCLSDVDGPSGPGRLTCFSAPAWWYPNDKYDQNNFRVKYYGDRFNDIYNYLGNAQDMFWDFKSVKDTFSII